MKILKQYDANSKWLNKYNLMSSFAFMIKSNFKMIRLVTDIKLLL